MISKKTRRLLSALLVGVAFFTGMFINHSRQEVQVPHQKITSRHSSFRGN